MMRRLWGRLLCRLIGHKRGRRINGPIPPDVIYQCHRCGAQWHRRIKAKAKP